MIPERYQNFLSEISGKFPTRKFRKASAFHPYLWYINKKRKYTWMLKMCSLNLQPDVWIGAVCVTLHEQWDPLEQCELFDSIPAATRGPACHAPTRLKVRTKWWERGLEDNDDIRSSCGSACLTDISSYDVSPKSTRYIPSLLGQTITRNLDTWQQFF